MGEFSSDFSFDFGDGAASQSPWEFKTALKDALEPHHASTSVEAKIERRAKAPEGGRPVTSEDDESEPDSEDEPLPGEEGESESEDEGILASRSSAARADAVTGSSSDEEESESEDDASDAEGVEIDLLGEDGVEGGGRSEEEEEESEEDDEEEVPGEVAITGEEEAQEPEASKRAGRSEAGAAAGGKARAGAASERGKAAVKAAPGATEAGFFSQTPTGTRFSATSFADLHLSRALVKACSALGYTRPTPIQAACIPLALSGRDVCGSAVTGSGKTAAFMLPLLERLLHRDRRVSATYVLVLTPVRELAVQVHGMARSLGQFTDIRAALAVGGLSLEAQAAQLRTRPEVVVGTPGRVIDHVRNTHSVGLEDLQALVVDEADRLLDMGFASELREIVRLAPRKRQTLLFSATMSDEVSQLASLSLRHPVRLAADAPTAAPALLRQEVVRLRGRAAGSREATLLALCARSFSDGHAIVFTRTKQTAHKLRVLFGLLGLPSAAELHGNMSQAARLEALEKFRTGEAKFLFATDVAARGLDIVGVRTVVNYDAPRNIETYLHRVGRTARAGASGVAVTLAADEDKALLKQIVKSVGETGKNAARAAPPRAKGGAKGARGESAAGPPAAGALLRKREVPATAVSLWQAKAEAKADDLRAVLKEEAEERMLRQSEMEATKASNMLEHEAEIAARPARTWFQSTKDKKAEAQRLRETALRQEVAGRGQGGLGLDAAAAGPAGPANHKQRREAEKSAARLERKRQAAKDRVDESRKRSRNALVEETEAQARAVKGVKARARALAASGITGRGATRFALEEAQRRDAPKGSKKGKGGLFSGDGLGPKAGGKSGSSAPATSSARVYAGGARTAEPKTAKKVGLSGLDLSRARRQGKGKHAFKSKNRHKRR